MAHGLPDEPGTHITTEDEQHKLDTWDELVAVLTKIAKVDPHGKISVFHITVLAQAALNAAAQSAARKAAKS